MQAACAREEIRSLNWAFPHRSHSQDWTCSVIMGEAENYDSAGG